MTIRKRPVAVLFLALLGLAAVLVTLRNGWTDAGSESESLVLKYSDALRKPVALDPEGHREDDPAAAEVIAGEVITGRVEQVSSPWFQPPAIVAESRAIIRLDKVKTVGSRPISEIVLLYDRYAVPFDIRVGDVLSIELNEQGQLLGVQPAAAR